MPPLPGSIPPPGSSSSRAQALLPAYKATPSKSLPPLASSRKSYDFNATYTPPPPAPTRVRSLVTGSVPPPKRPRRTPSAETRNAYLQTEPPRRILPSSSPLNRPSNHDLSSRYASTSPPLPSVACIHPSPSPRLPPNLNPPAADLSGPGNKEKLLLGYDYNGKAIYGSDGQGADTGGEEVGDGYCEGERMEAEIDGGRYGSNETVDSDSRAVEGPLYIDQGEELVEDELEDYSELLFGGGLSVTRIDRRSWVVEGYEKGVAALGKFAHVSVEKRPDGTVCCADTVCDCGIRISESCIHRRVLVAAWDRFNAETQMSQLGTPPLLQPFHPLVDPYALSMSLDDPTAIEVVVNRFGIRSYLSVRSSQPGAKKTKRTIVRWIGNDRWYCSSCKHIAPASTCHHRGYARDYMRSVAVSDEEFTTEMEGEFEDGELLNMDELDPAQLDPVVTRSHLARHPTSYLPVPPPRFAALPTDQVKPIPYQPPSSLPGIISLYPTTTSPSPRCNCGKDAVAGSPERLLDCRIYSSVGVTLRKIRVQKCGCRTRGRSFTIGADLSEYGLFNWNNEIVITHELLNAYTSQLSASSTPINAFHTTVHDAYLQHDSPIPFFSVSTFNLVFFAFITLQGNDITFECPKCGPNPTTVIADGVSTAFHSRHRQSTLRPPTVPLNNLSFPPSLVAPINNTTFLPNKKMRDGVAAAIRETSAAVKLAGEARISDEEHEGNWAPLSGVAELFFSPALDDPHQAALAALFKYLPHLVKVSHTLPSLYFILLRQLAAHESVLQLCRPPTARILAQALNPSPSSYVLSQLQKESPAIGNIINEYSRLSHPLPKLLHTLLDRLRSKVDDVFEKLQQRHRVGRTGAPGIEVVPEEDWAKTGVCYGLPKIRERREYVNFKEGGGVCGIGVAWGAAPRTVPSQIREQEKKERAAWEKKETGECQKFYGRYTERKQTGGIMALWCTHSVCLGFHIIPRAEGRNDVFSAILSRWATAPLYIIYDFACALAPYCLAREAEYFQNTTFLIDEFHEKDHTKCSPACFLDSYMANNIQLKTVNSSAAECGNAGLARIRKTVSYCSQAHAILFTRHFLQIWNRKCVAKFAI